jgi:hypothetical protein
VALHDYDLARKSSGVGSVYEGIIDEVRPLEAGDPFGERFTGQQISFSRRISLLKESSSNWR